MAQGPVHCWLPSRSAQSILPAWEVVRPQEENIAPLSSDLRGRLGTWTLSHGSQGCGLGQPCCPGRSGSCECESQTERTHLPSGLRNGVLIAHGPAGPLPLFPHRHPGTRVRLLFQFSDNDPPENDSHRNVT